jgi:hypothetical protein
MRTPKQTEASRANGAKSKGPVTPQGKINSSRNSTRHGMFADTIVLEAEEKSQFLELLEELFEEHQPRTRTESMLVETIAAARWRQERIWGMQKIAFDYDVSSSASLAELNPLRAVLGLRNSPESVRTHELLLRYEIALDRQISRALLRLHQLQDREVRPAEFPESAPAVRTQQPVETTTQPPPPAAPIPPSRPPQSRPMAPTPTEMTIALPPISPKSTPPRKKPAA